MIKKDPKALPKGDIVLYGGKGKAPRLDVRLIDETVWLSQAQIAELFGTQRPAITKHLRNIFQSGELSEKSVCSILEHTAVDGKVYKTTFYNLDAIISVGYRVNSKRATQFRIWATNVLREYVINGFVLNQKRLHETGLSEFEQALALVRQAMESKALRSDEAKGLLQVIADYANSWLLLQKYDEGKLELKKTTEGKYHLTYDEAIPAIVELKTALMEKGEAGDLFGNERDTMLSAILGNINQTFGGKELYPSIEAKAAHLLYFIIKDHPFSDGNKRIGAFLFIVFLTRNHYLFNKKGERKINDNALVALALLVAESDPKQKEIMVKLIMNLLHA